MKKKQQYKKGGFMSNFLKSDFAQGAYGYLDGVVGGLASTVGLGGAYDSFSNSIDKGYQKYLGKNLDTKLMKRAEGFGTIVGGVTGGLATGNVMAGVSGVQGAISDFQDAEKIKTKEDQAQFNYALRKSPDTTFQDVSAGLTSLVGNKFLNNKAFITMPATQAQTNPVQSPTGMIMQTADSLAKDTTNLLPGQTAINIGYMPTFKQGGYMYACGGKMYAMGGTMTQGEVEDKEVVQTPSGQVQQIHGKTHEQGGENITSPTGSFVFSDRVMVNTQQSFADIAAKVSKSVNPKLQKQYGNLDMFANNSIKAMNNKLNMLAISQEMMKQSKMKYNG